MMMMYREQQETDAPLFEDGTGKLPKLVDDLEFVNRSESDQATHESYYEFEPELSDYEPKHTKVTTHDEPPLHPAEEFPTYEVPESDASAFEFAPEPAASSVQDGITEPFDPIDDPVRAADELIGLVEERVEVVEELAPAYEEPPAFVEDRTEVVEEPNKVVETKTESFEAPFETPLASETQDPHFYEFVPQADSNGSGKNNKHKKQERSDARDLSDAQDAFNRPQKKKKKNRLDNHADNRSENREDAGSKKSGDDRKERRPKDRKPRVEAPSAAPEPVNPFAEPQPKSADIYSHGPAVGVESSIGNYTDFIAQKHPAEEPKLPEAEEQPYDYQLFSLDDEYAKLPRPEVFNAYPPEVQRKILEWTDRDVKARRDDESRRQDAILHARISREGMRTTVPVIIAILGIICAAITGVMTKNPVFAIAFLIIPLAIIIAFIVYGKWGNTKQH